MNAYNSTLYFINYLNIYNLLMKTDKKNQFSNSETSYFSKCTMLNRLKEIIH
jgi:hypothetical protein